MNRVSRHFALPLAIVVCIVGLACTETRSEESNEKPEVLRVLFIGNSLTYTNDLPKIIEALANSAPKDRPRIKASQITSAGFMLKGHWERTGKGSPRDRIANEKWDAVVLQEGVYAVPDDITKYTENFEKYVPLFHALIDKNGSRTILFCPATFDRLYPKSFNAMHDVHAAMGKKLKLPVAAGGKTWLNYLGDNPTTEQLKSLYSDNVHPSAKGSYLFACSLYAAMTGLSPAGLTNELPKQLKDVVTPDEAKKMQEVAWKVYQQKGD